MTLIEKLEKFANACGDEESIRTITDLVIYFVYELPYLGGRAEITILKDYLPSDFSRLTKAQSMASVVIDSIIDRPKMKIYKDVNVPGAFVEYDLLIGSIIRFVDFTRSTEELSVHETMERETLHEYFNRIPSNSSSVHVDILKEFLGEVPDSSTSPYLHFAGSVLNAIRTRENLEDFDGDAVGFHFEESNGTQPVIFSNHLGAGFLNKEQHKTAVKKHNAEKKKAERERNKEANKLVAEKARADAKKTREEIRRRRVKAMATTATLGARDHVVIKRTDPDDGRIEFGYVYRITDKVISVFVIDAYCKQTHRSFYPSTNGSNKLVEKCTSVIVRGSDDENAQCKTINDLNLLTVVCNKVGTDLRVASRGNDNPLLDSPDERLVKMVSECAELIRSNHYDVMTADRRKQ